MDLPGADAAVRLRELRGRFGDGCVDFSAVPDPEALALCSEPLMNEVLDTGTPAPETVITAIARRQVFPVFFGAALRLDGLDGLLRGLQTLTRTPPQWPEFGARVFKISEDAGTRLTWLKVTGGVLHVKDVLPGGERPTPCGCTMAASSAWSVRRFPAWSWQWQARQPPAGAGPWCRIRRGRRRFWSLCSTTASTVTPTPTPFKSPADPRGRGPAAPRQLARRLGEVHVQLMGEVQLEILQNILQDRFGLDVTFSEGGILYKETLTTAVEGIGHYEPLRHYAEVHLLLEPGARGSGVQLAADCPPDTLAENWQRLILTHLAERTHPRRADRCAADRRKDHAGGGPRPPETHRGRRLPPGHLPRRAPGPCGWPQPRRRGIAGTVV